MKNSAWTNCLNKPVTSKDENKLTLMSEMNCTTTALHCFGQLMASAAMHLANEWKAFKDNQPKQSIKPLHELASSKMLTIKFILFEPN